MGQIAERLPLHSFYAVVRGRRARAVATSRFVLAFALAVAATHSLPAVAQQSAASAVMDCAEFQSSELVMPPEFISANGVLKGRINLVDELRRLPREQEGAASCRGARVRVFKGEGLSPTPSAKNPVAQYSETMPGPTLRARVGDIVQLSFVNTVNPRRFVDPRSLDIEECVEVGRGGSVYPVGGAPGFGGRGGTPRFQDKYPNCLHASSTANIHFHGTHTTPNGTGDNVYLQVRPLPRDAQQNPAPTPAQVTAGFDAFFRKCADELKNPLNAWPSKWSDVPKPSGGKSWTDQQTELLMAYQQKNPSQPLWDKNKEVLNDSWPIYYIGAFPYCFALPAYKEGVPPIMGQAPGTHWYHAHKHGSTAINVANGMTGAFIIEGDYDADLNAAYGKYRLADGKTWSARSQKVMVLNQLMDDRHPHATAVVPRLPIPGGVDFSVNGRWRPTVKMQPGEIQLWRIVNTSSRTAAYFIPPEGLQWQQIAQDGVQYAPRSFENGANLNKPFYMAPANRVDLLVKAPSKPTVPSVEVRVQNVMALSMVEPSPANPDPFSKWVLLTVEVAGPLVEPEEMPFLTELTAPKLPPFLKDISDEEWKQGNSITRTFVFNSKKPTFSATDPSMAGQHTINGIQFDEGPSFANILLGATEEWIIKNMTTIETGPPNSRIDHPLHIHINPFQVTERFDPNESFIDKTTGEAVPRYVTDETPSLVEGQCLINPRKEETWKPCYDTRLANWWDVYAMPAGKVPADKDGNPVLDSQNQPIVIPGYFKMRTRFVDFPGLYVMHCHILIHEDRGMMFRVEVLKAKTAPAPVRHH